METIDSLVTDCVRGLAQVAENERRRARVTVTRGQMQTWIHEVNFDEAMAEAEAILAKYTR